MGFILVTLGSDTRFSSVDARLGWFNNSNYFPSFVEEMMENYRQWVSGFWNSSPKEAYADRATSLLAIMADRGPSCILPKGTTMRNWPLMKGWFSFRLEMSLECSKKYSEPQKVGTWL